MPFNPKSHSLCWEALSMCYGTVSIFWQVVYKTALAFASRFCSVSRTENRAVSDLSWPCARPHVCSWFSRFPGIIGTFQRSYGHLISHYFLLSLLVSVLFAPTVITASGSWYVKHLLLTVFDKCPGENTIHIDCILVHGKYRQALRAGVSRELSNRSVQFSSVQSLSCVRLFVTPWITARQASLSIINSWSLFTLMSIESVMPSNQLILSSPSLPAFNLSQHQGLFIWVSSSHQVAKVLEFQFQYQSFQWRNHSSKASILWHSAFFMVQLSHPYVTTGKNTALTRWTLPSK